MNENVFRTDIRLGSNAWAKIIADFSGLDLGEMTGVELVDLAIEKWRTVRGAFDSMPDGARVYDGGVDTCALCQMYHGYDGDCAHCPIP